MGFLDPKPLTTAGLDTATAAKITTPGTATATALNATIGDKILADTPDLVASEISNPETPASDAVSGLITAALSGFSPTDSVKFLYIGSVLSTPRPDFAGTIVWVTTVDAVPTYVAAGDLHFFSEPTAIPDVWSPLDIATLLGWWDERYLPPAADADYGTLYERSGLASHLIPATTGATDTPQYDPDGIAAQPSVYIPAGSGMILTSPVAWGTGALAVFLGVKMGATNGVAQTVFNGQNTAGAAQSFALIRTADGASWGLRRGGTIRLFAHATANDGNPHAICVVFNGASSELFIDGTSIGVVSATPGSGSVTNFHLGIRDASTDSGSVADYLNGGRITSPFVMGGVPTTDERTDATAFITARITV